ncbi:glycerophosphodiester phosphodiesterase [Lactovum miscens]|uniref:Glycerophosphoryl diester phosphodiesterase n=1 Tax=Lactovum miscens TaxID=190387 RepID=A0A841C943_9LACT|nr:glycerophosphodiester phosphodiesterase family protein [Lactovum miscens]MBB5887909.1 glycerophosphoryl diester phosphodiesterase [Lactovum miscens]
MEIQSHRGNAVGFVENTLEAFQNIISKGVASIESDVRFTKDKVLVLHHDGELGRVFEGVEQVKNLTYLELQGRKNLILPDKKAHIPSLSDVLDLCKLSGCKINIEFKLEEYQNYQSLVKAVLAMVNEKDMTNLVYYSSFHFPALTYLRTLEKRDCFWLLEQMIPGLADYLPAIDFQGFHMDIKVWRHLPENIKNDLKNAGIVRLWTVNDKTDIELARKDGIDTIITDQALELI